MQHVNGCVTVDNCNSLSSIFRYIIKYGPESRANKWSKQQPLMVLFRDNLEECIDRLVNTGDEQYDVVCRSGYCGCWCNIMFAAILSSRYSSVLGKSSPSKGVYPCYLFAEDLSEVYLCYMMASGDKYENTLKRIVREIRNLGVFEDYENDTSTMVMGKDTHKYRFATICFKKYALQDIGDNNKLERDLMDLMDIHRQHGDRVYELYMKNMKT